jgi:site-specific DNA-methyltransferase (adenine-specific)
MVSPVIIGNATLYLGDCRDILPSLVDVDLVVTSPPYNCGKDYGETGDSLSLLDLKALLRAGVFEAPARAFVVNVGQYIGSRSERVLFRDVLLDASPHPLIDEVVWDKGPANGAAWGNYPNSPRIRAQHESIYLFGNPKMPNGNGLSWADWSRLTTSIWRVPANVDLKVHPAMMPVELARRCVRLWADSAGVVCDPFLGSGTSGVAALEMGRRFIGIERDERYFEIACRRIDDAQRQGDMFAVNAA